MFYGIKNYTPNGWALQLTSEYGCNGWCKVMVRKKAGEMQNWNDVLSVYEWMNWTTRAAHCFNGHNMSCDVAHCVIVSFCGHSFAAWMRERHCGWERSSPFLQKLMLWSVSCFVCLSLGHFTFRYLHYWHAKKKAPMMSWAVACRSSVVLLADMSPNSRRV